MLRAFSVLPAAAELLRILLPTVFRNYFPQIWCHNTLYPGMCSSPTFFFLPGQRPSYFEQDKNLCFEFLPFFFDFVLSRTRGSRITVLFCRHWCWCRLFVKLVPGEKEREKISTIITSSYFHSYYAENSCSSCALLLFFSSGILLLRYFSFLLTVLAFCHASILHVSMADVNSRLLSSILPNNSRYRN